MTKWLKNLWFKLTYDEIAMKCRQPLGKSLFIFVLMSGICSAQTINYVDVNGVTKLYIRTGTSTPETTPGTLQFKSSTYSVSEDGSAIRVYVSRASGSDGAASVNYATANGTAIADTDYTAASGTLNWIDGNADDKYFDVTIIDNNTVGSSRNFTVGLSSASGASLGSITSTTITITEDDTVSLDYDPNWPYGIGIPTPPFGIDETYRMYDDVNNQNSELTYYDSPSGGKYTHYVDSTDPNATANGTPSGYGSPAHPRLNIPYKNLLAGSIVEVHNDSSANDYGYIQIGGEGTAQYPIFIRGVDKPNIDLRMSVGYYANSSYIIVEGMKFRKGSVAARAKSTPFETNHIAVRDCNFSTSIVANEDSGFGISGTSDSNNQTSYVVLNNCKVFDNGIYDLATNPIYQFDFMEYDTNEAAQAVWSGTGVTVGTSSIHSSGIYSSSYSLSCLIDGTGNRTVSKSHEINMSLMNKGFTVYTRCDTTSSTIKFYIKDANDNISYFNITTSSSANTWKLTNYSSLLSPSSNNGTNANRATIVEYGFIELDAGVTYLFDVLHAESDIDVGGVRVNANYVWVLNSEMYRNACNGIQIGGTVSGDNAPNHVYIAKNIMHNNGQSGSGTKTCYDLIFSQNVSYSPLPSSSGGFILQYDPQRVWFLFNTAYNADRGFRSGSGLVGPANPDYDTYRRKEIYLIGNLIYDCNIAGLEFDGHEPPTNSPIMFNTIYNCPIGIYNGYYDAKINAFNNIIANCTTVIDFLNEYNSDVYSSFDYNLLDGTGNIKWNNTYANLAAFQAGSTQGDNCLEADPLFVNAGAYDFDLQAESPFKTLALDPTVQAAIDRFYELYNIDIEDEILEIKTNGTQNAP